MILPASAQRMTRPLLLVAAIVVVLAYAFWGAPRGIAALLGATLAVGNWFALRWLAARFVAANGNAAALSFLLIAKIGLLMAIVYVLIARIRIDPIGLAFGLGVLFVGPVLAGLLATPSGTAQALDSAAVRAAREER